MMAVPWDRQVTMAVRDPATKGVRGPEPVPGLLGSLGCERRAVRGPGTEPL